MILEINFESEEPIYLQLRNRIIEGIAQKKLCPGESLPSVRVMAAELGINLHTVNKSYNLLKKDGFIIIHKRKGVLINHLEKMQDSDFTIEFEESLKPLIAEAICKGIEKEKIQEICDKVYNIMKGDKSCPE
jgi:GntR family transcriptional regulator